MGRNRGRAKGPLREIVGYVTEGALRVEKLECGHTQMPVKDAYGETNAYRRRCWQCRREEA
jgi:hypothetical protein